jgi:hypothetical protein
MVLPYPVNGCYLILKENVILIVDNTQIYVLLDKNTKNVYMKPSKPYFSANFETLFGFGIGCSEYDPEKIIVVKEPDEYYKNFESYFK